MKNSTNTQQQGETDLAPARIIYILYGLGFALPILTIAGVIYAYLSKGKSQSLDSHISFQLRTFWFGLPMLATGAILAVFLIGYLLIALWFIWTLIRIITGFELARKGSAARNPKGFGFVA